MGKDAANDGQPFLFEASPAVLIPGHSGDGEVRCWIAHDRVGVVGGLAGINDQQAPVAGDLLPFGGEKVAPEQHVSQIAAVSGHVEENNVVLVSVFLQPVQAVL